MNIFFEIYSQSHPIAVARGVFEIYLGSHVCHLFMSSAKDFASDIVFFVGCFRWNIWTVSAVILPSFKKKPIDENPTRMVGVLADDVKERIGGCTLSEGVVAFAFQVLSELKGTNIKGSGELVREGVIIINRGIRDREVFVMGYVV